VDIDGRSVLVASIDDLIRMKRAAGRPKDTAVIPELAALRDEFDRRRSRDAKLAETILGSGAVASPPRFR
jgi:hypothetical protein